MTKLSRSKIHLHRKNILLAAASLFLAVSCLAATPFALGINFNPQEARQEARQREEREQQERRRQEGEGVKNEELEARRQQERAKMQATLAKEAKITMGQAIQFATYQQPGTVLECRLVRERGEIFFNVVVFSGNDVENNTAYIQISAVDGRILKTEKER